MSSYIIEGGNKLEGTVKISGSKNSALPIIAATILNAGKTTLYNVPNIQDTQMMYKILETLGAKIENIITFKLPKQDINRNLIIIKKIRKTDNNYPRNYDKILKHPL